MQKRAQYMQQKLTRQSTNSQGGIAPNQNMNRAYDSSEVPEDQAYTKGKIQTI